MFLSWFPLCFIQVNLTANDEAHAHVRVLWFSFAHSFPSQDGRRTAIALPIHCQPHTFRWLNRARKKQRMFAKSGGVRPLPSAHIAVNEERRDCALGLEHPFPDAPPDDQYNSADIMGKGWDMTNEQFEKAFCSRLNKWIMGDWKAIRF
jgi:hypothetical protein